MPSAPPSRLVGPVRETVGTVPPMWQPLQPPPVLPVEYADAFMETKRRAPEATRWFSFMACNPTES